ncbi:MAG: tripartite tricarboxylate transporter substrate binding protein [Deltaproteobacteria bacterium]
MKRMTSWISACFAVVSLMLIAQPLQAQTYPSQPIQVIVPMAPGDTVDLAGRAISTELAKILKTPVVVNNKPGGGATIGADFVAKGKKDGYTLLFANSNIYFAHAMNPADVPYDALKDLDVLCLAVSTPLTITVRGDAPWKTFQELVDYMKKNPGKIRGSSSGVGSVGHFNFDLVQSEAGVAINMIPYKGASPAMTALLGGHVEISTLSYSLIYPQFMAGQLRPLLISNKVKDHPEIPTLKQLGYKNDIFPVRFAFYGPAGLSDSVKKTLAGPMQKAITHPEVVSAIEKIGAVEDYQTGEEFRKLLLQEHALVQKFVKAAGPAPATK